MTNIHTLQSETVELRTCPVLVYDDDNDVDSISPCDVPLVPIATYKVVGDDYGSWTQVSMQFQCGHTFADMETSFRHAGEI